ncbi:stage III sporulation protein AE [Blautia sp. HCP3S3_H10_1]|uniref:stage III sporulation protein AE n=1 Tax=unclassified Blautia TaxID=2648079 RepID=UPI003F905D80|nr:stage III sporulation protein AE [Clostridia bacterium]
MKTGAAKRYYGIFAACVSFSFMIFVSCWQNENRIVKAEAQSGQSFAATERTDIMDEESETTHADSGISESVTSQMVSDMSFEQVQKLMDEMLGNNSFSIGTALENMINGKSVVSKEAVQQFLRSLFFDRIEKERENFFRILLLVLAAAVFSNFAAVFENSQIGDVSFYMVYLLLFTILMDSYQQLGISLGKQLDWMTQFMKGLAPAYFIAISAASGTVTASVFYQGVLLLVWLVQWLLLTLILPGANLYVLLCLVNHLSKEDMLSKMAELLETLISWSLKTMLGAVLGLQAVRGLVAPAMDALKRTAIGKTAGAIPAVGNAVNVVTELILTGALLVKNCLGAVSVLALFLVGAGPVIHYGLLSLGYRFLGAIAQPVSDKRIVGCLGTMGEGCAMLLRIMLTAEILCILTFVILMASVGR